MKSSHAVSQVALDVPQLSGNTEFALYLPEKRPFFFESSDLLHSPTEALYTRSFTAPRWGVRSTWRGSALAGTAFIIDDKGGGETLLPYAYGTNTALQPGSRTLLTEVDIANPDGALPVGIYCTVELHIPRKAPSLIVPAEAVIFNAGGVQVAVVDNGVVHLHKVTVARDFGTSVELRDGVAAGDQVILNPSVSIAEGAKVKIHVNPSGSAAAASPYGTK